MINDRLLKKAFDLGFQADEPAGQNDANQTLAEVVQSYEPRLWEAFPVMLANAAEAGEFSLDAVTASLAEEERKYLKLLIFVSLGLYDVLGIEFTWRKLLFGNFPARLIANFGEKLKLDTGLELGKVTLQPKKLRKNLLSHRQKTANPPMSWGISREDAALESAMSRIFTARQKSLLLKRLNREKMTKTETEYFSRVIKKKARALANEDLHRLARQALE